MSLCCVYRVLSEQQQPDYLLHPPAPDSLIFAVKNYRKKTKNPEEVGQ